MSRSPQRWWALAYTAVTLTGPAAARPGIAGVTR